MISDRTHAFVFVRIGVAHVLACRARCSFHGALTLVPRHADFLAVAQLFGSLRTRSLSFAPCFLGLFGVGGFVFGRRATGDEALLRLVCLVLANRVGLVAGAGNGLLLRPLVCGSQNIGLNNHTVWTAAPKIVPSDSRNTLAHFALSSPLFSPSSPPPLPHIPARCRVPNGS